MNQYGEAGAVLIVELDGNSDELTREECLIMGELCLEHGAMDAFIAESPSDQARIWSCLLYTSRCV